MVAGGKLIQHNAVTSAPLYNSSPVQALSSDAAHQVLNQKQNII